MTRSRTAKRIALLSSSLLLAAGLAGTAGCGGATESSAVLQSIAVITGAPSVPKGLTDGVTAIGTYSDGSLRDLTPMAYWTTSEPAMTTIAQAGSSESPLFFSGQDQGLVTISASFENITGSAQVMITRPVVRSLTIALQLNSVPVEFSDQCTVMGAFSDGSDQDVTKQVKWSVSDDDAAMIANDPDAAGRFTGTSAGVSTVTASLNGVTATADILVTP